MNIMTSRAKNDQHRTQTSSAAGNSGSNGACQLGTKPGPGDRFRRAVEALHQRGVPLAELNRTQQMKRCEQWMLKEDQKIKLEIPGTRSFGAICQELSRKSWPVAADFFLVLAELGGSWRGMAIA